MSVWPKNKHYVRDYLFLSSSGIIQTSTNNQQKELGAWLRIAVTEAFEGGAMAVLTRYETWKPEEVKVLAAGARNDLKNRDIHAIMDL